ncbi:MAG: hypothetical protein GTN78_17795, partial [Gemmatimonadales bacterium]|nr:hypothetical protein [Gemmatimonadales bacterium]
MRKSIQDFAWQIDCVSRHGVENVSLGLYLSLSPDWYASSQSLVEPFGGKAIPDETDAAHWWAMPAVSDPADALELEAPRTLGPQIEKAVHLIEYMRDSVEGAYPVGGFVLTGPLDTASYVMGFQSLMEAIYEHPEAVEHVCSIVTDFLLFFIPVLLRASDPEITGEGISSAGCYLCCETRAVLSDAVVAQFEVPYLKRIRDAFGSLHIHSCGNWVQHMGRLARERYADSIDFGHPECDFKQVASIVEGA